MSNSLQQHKPFFAREGDISIRRMRDDIQDYMLMSKWLTDERVLEFFVGRDDPQDVEKVMKEYGPGARGEDSLVPCILNWQERPVGFIQYYPVTGSDCGKYGIETAGSVYGVDLFIGEPDIWGRGLGTRALRCLIKYLFSKVNASRIIIDPQVSNHRAIGCYEKSGFRKFKILPKHELHEGEYRDNWLMTIDHERYGEHVKARPH